MKQNEANSIFKSKLVIYVIKRETLKLLLNSLYLFFVMEDIFSDIFYKNYGLAALKGIIVLLCIHNFRIILNASYYEYHYFLSLKNEQIRENNNKQ